MKKRVLILMLFLGSLVCPMFTIASPGDNPKPVIYARAAILIEESTGKVLYAKNPNVIMAPASTTKIMTGILCIEKGNLDRIVQISSNAASRSGSRMNLRRNERFSLRDLLYGLLLSSGNDAATAIAEAIAGSEYRFSLMMTRKARELGLMHTRYINASGLPAVNHYTTAYDLARLARYALRNPLFASIVQTKEAMVPGPTPNQTTTLRNHNKLLWDYPYTTGIKTGYTRKAGRCLVASAKKRNVTLIAVVLKSGNVYHDSRLLFDYGYKLLGVPDPEPETQQSNTKQSEPVSPDSSIADMTDTEFENLETNPVSSGPILISPGSIIVNPVKVKVNEEEANNE
jgi:D-alanyl-D-alanine carboxypeptidase (penicillin-binding protein 5/6)